MEKPSLEQGIVVTALAAVAAEALAKGGSPALYGQPDPPHSPGGYSKWTPHPGGGQKHVSGLGTYHSKPVGGGQHSLTFKPHGSSKVASLGSFGSHAAANSAQVAHHAKLASSQASGVKAHMAKQAQRLTSGAAVEESHKSVGKGKDPLEKSAGPIPPLQQWKSSPGNTHRVDHFASHGSYHYMPSLGQGGSHSMTYTNYKSGKTSSLGSFKSGEGAHKAAQSHHQSCK